MAVLEPLMRKQLLKNAVPEAEQGQQTEWVWVFPNDVFEMSPRCYYGKCLRAQGCLAGNVQGTAAKEQRGKWSRSVLLNTEDVSCKPGECGTKCFPWQEKN